jgi:hypothetical protein
MDEVRLALLVTGYHGAMVSWDSGEVRAIASGDVDHLIVRPGQVGQTVFEPQARALVLDAASAVGSPFS